VVRTGFLTTAAIAALLIAVSGCRIAGSAEPPPFDGPRAFSLLERQVAFGPRIPGTDTHTETAEWLAGQLRDLCPNVSMQRFTDEFDGRSVDMTNIIASFYSGKRERVLLCAHWDSRPKADRDPDPTLWTQPVPGANDGASGVAVLLEMARILAEHEPPVGVDIVFFDGEDGGSYGDNDTWLLGSRYFAAAMPDGYRPRWAVLLDMIGDRDLSLTRDANSRYGAPDLWRRLQDEAGKAGVSFSERETVVIDDHVPLIERGIPAIDLIDFDYPWWHTVADTPDKCSPESLEKIGTIVLRLVYGEES